MKPAKTRAGIWMIPTHSIFWCEFCGGTHPIVEHRYCRTRKDLREQQEAESIKET